MPTYVQRQCPFTRLGASCNICLLLESSDVISEQFVTVQILPHAQKRRKPLRKSNEEKITFFLINVFLLEPQLY